MGKWEDKLPIIRFLADKIPASQIAKMFGITTANLYRICNRYGIKYLKQPNKFYTKDKPKMTMEAAKNFLLDKGYKVIPPDPFLGQFKRMAK